jgi:heterodisulfide reductase subunit A
VDVKSLAEEIRRERLDRIVLAGDSPGYFKPAFTRALELAGGDPSEVRLASFREHGAGMVEATDRAKAVLACAVHGVPYPLVAIPKPTVVHPATLIVGGGVAGIQTALEIADAEEGHGGTIGTIGATWPCSTRPSHLDCAACILIPRWWR